MPQSSSVYTDASTLLDQLPGVSYRCLMDSHWTMLEVGVQIEAICGYTAQHFLNREISYSDLILEEDRTAVYEGVLKGLENGVFYLEYRIRDRGGQVRYVWEQGRGIYGQSGELESLAGYICEANPRIARIKLSRRASESVLELACNQHLARGDVEVFCRYASKLVAEVLGIERVGIWLMDGRRETLALQVMYVASADTYHTDMSLRCADNADYIKTLLAERIFYTHDGHRDPRASSLLERYLQARDVRSLLHCAVLQAGELVGVVCVETVEEYRFWTAEEVAFVAAVADQVSHVIANRELRETENRLLELQASHEARSQFLSMLSHEVRTPLNGVLGVADLLAMTDLDATQKEYVELIESSGQLLLRVIGDILDYSKIETGQLDMHPQPTDLKGLCSDCVELLRPEALRKGLALELSVDPSLPEVCQLDTLRLQQVLLNLLINAIRFTERGGIQLLAKVGQQDQLQLSVVDTGVGVAPELQSRIFEPFTQDRLLNAQRSIKGAGLGLSICQGLVELMAGSITLHSRVGQGSEFIVTLPLKGVARESDVGCRSINRDFSGMKVLVAEDNAVNRKVVNGMLKLLKVQAELCNDGAEAVERVRSAGRPFDLILMDCEMPVMDGFEAVKEIRQLPAPQGNVYIAALTAHALQEYRDRAEQVGMNAYLTKPLQRQELTDLLSQLQP